MRQENKSTHCRMMWQNGDKLSTSQMAIGNRQQGNRKADKAGKVPGWKGKKWLTMSRAFAQNRRIAHPQTAMGMGMGEDVKCPNTRMGVSASI